MQPKRGTEGADPKLYQFLVACALRMIDIDWLGLHYEIALESAAGGLVHALLRQLAIPQGIRERAGSR